MTPVHMMDVAGSVSWCAIGRSLSGVTGRLLAGGCRPPMAATGWADVPGPGQATSDGIGHLRVAFLHWRLILLCRGGRVANDAHRAEV